MNKYIFNTYEHHANGTTERYTYTRISKRQAIKEHNAGRTLYIAGCKANLNSMWIYPAEMHGIADFDNFINCWSYYNANNETGSYPAFYTLTTSVCNI